MGLEGQGDAEVLVDVELAAHGFRLAGCAGAVVGDVVQLDLAYSDLVPATVLRLRLRDIEGRDARLARCVEVGLLSEAGVVKQGSYKLPLGAAHRNPRLGHLEATVKRFEEDPAFPLVPWMDEIALGLVDQERRADLAAGGAYLLVDLQRFDHPVRVEPRRLDLGRRLKERMNRRGAVALLEGARRGELVDLITAKPFTWSLVSDERVLIWRHRDKLPQCPRALMLFIKSVDWIDDEEVAIVQGLVERWAPLAAHQVLELLAIKPPLDEGHRRMVWDTVVRPALLTQEAAFKPFLPQLVQVFLTLLDLKGRSYDFYPDMLSADPVNFFVAYLIKLATEDAALGTQLFWHLRVASRHFQSRGAAGENVFAKLQGMFLGSLSQRAGGPQASEHYYQQVELFGKLEDLLKAVKRQKSTREQKLAVIMDDLDNPAKGYMAFNPMPLPLDTAVTISGILADRSVLFKSNALPLKVHFIASTPGDPGGLQIYPVIFKEGDDLRQDQLVLELVALIDRIWKRNRLDLRLTPYRVLATSVTTGLVQFVPSLPLSTILAENGNNLRAYLSGLAPGTRVDGFETLAIDPAIHDNYLRSSAGYSVLTYVLGVGDRHLENLLLTDTGHLFHVDFTYVFGRDPKPFPPPMKLCREMVEAMSGVAMDMNAERFPQEYLQFKRFSFTAFCLLRRNARELLTAIALLSHSGTADLSQMVSSADSPDLPGAVAPPHYNLEPGLHVSRSVLFVQERLMLDVDEEEALRRFDQLITESVTALFPQVMETLHKWAQYWRN